MLFPHLTNFHPKLKETILSRAGNNTLVSGYIPWMRLTASSGLIIESLPQGDSFSTRYGDMTKSGRVGTDLSGNSIYADGEDRAYRPSPIVESLSVTFGAGGLTRKCEFEIKCFTLPQAEKVMEYFLEPGYTVLVEYGWNTNNSISQKASPLDACAIAKYNSYDHIKRKQINSNFEYDGFMGYITNGGFKTGDGETYVINVELTSVGDVAMYLQQHRGGSTTKNNQNPGGEVFNAGDIDTISSTDVGMALFMQMYNRLPKQKQTKRIKDLTGKTDSRGIKWISQDNYINIDEVIKKQLIDELEDTSVEAGGEEGGGDAAIPEGAPLISESSYIRLELAFEILNSYSIDLKSSPSECSGLGTYNTVIEYNNTIIRGTPNMFSHDGSKLLIPNPNTPDFKLSEVLKSSSTLNFDNILNDSGKPTKVVNLSQGEFKFPQQVSLSSAGHKWPADAIPFEAGAGQWGYLKDLYINFEFFIEVLERSNYIAKDIYYELLNGISSAANSMWHYEINELPSVSSENKDQYQLEIVDLNFCGGVSNSNTKFRASGAYTPFIESNLSLDIPSAMKNMIVAERSAGQPDASAEGNLPVKTGTLFSTKQDPVVRILSNFEKKATDEKGGDDEASGASSGNQSNEGASGGGAEKLTEEEIKKANYDLFMSKATVLPAVKDRNGDIDAIRNGFLEFFGVSTTNTTIEQLVYVAGWNDPSLFRKLDLNNRSSTSANNVLLEIAFDFKIHGVSGIKTGDLFEIEDLPRKYKDTVFQVVEVSHALEGNLWTTSVTGKMRKKDENL